MLAGGRFDSGQGTLSEPELPGREQLPRVVLAPPRWMFGAWAFRSGPSSVESRWWVGTPCWVLPAPETREALAIALRSRPWAPGSGLPGLSPPDLRGTLWNQCPSCVPRSTGEEPERLAPGPGSRQGDPVCLSSETKCVLTGNIFPGAPCPVSQPWWPTSGVQPGGLSAPSSSRTEKAGVWLPGPQTPELGPRRNLTSGPLDPPLPAREPGMNNPSCLPS